MAEAVEQHGQDEARERAARELARLGAETPQARAMKRVVPWAVSLLVHVAVVVVALFITWTVSRVVSEEDPVLIVADFDAMTYEPLASLSQAQQMPSEEPAAADRADAPQASEVVRDRLAEAVPRDPMELLAGELASAAAELSGLAPRAGGEGVTFAGLSSTNARRVVYLLDASGSMVRYFPMVVDELSRSLATLSPQQSFGVIFFQGESAIEVPPAGRLSPGTAEAARGALEWIRSNVVVRGGTNPVAAIDKALDLQPDVIFLLSQDITGMGAFEVDQRDLLAQLEELNPRDPATGKRRTQINCIQFIEPDALETMSKIAAEHGGPNGYRLLTEQQLGLR